MNKYEHHNHSKYKIRYHIILSVKYHRRLLFPIISDLKQSLERAQNDSRYWKIETTETDQHKDHHIHILIKATPQIAPYDIIHKIKQITTYDMWKKHRQYLLKYFWNGKHHLWTRGYFCSTIGDVSEQTLKDYIERQG